MPDEQAQTSGAAPTTVDVRELITDADLLDHTLWVLEHLEPEVTGPALTAVGERFSPEMLEELPGVQLGLVFAQVRALGPFTVTGATTSAASPGSASGTTSATTHSATVSLHSDQQALIMSIAVDDGLIAGLFFQPDTTGELPELSTFADLDQALTELDAEAQVVVGQVDAGSCTLTYTSAGVVEGGEPAPSGSAFKLLVLAALTDAIDAGEFDWQDELVISEGLKSLPSGVLQDREAGSVVTIAEAAELMISISDNTATDLIMTAIGQDQLKATAQTIGMAERADGGPWPIPTTRQLFQLGWQVPQEVRDRWQSAPDEAGRQAILDALPIHLKVDPLAVQEPVWPDGVEYFFTGAELCTVHARLQQQAGDPNSDSEAGAPLRDILAENPGISPPAGTTYQAFKGGSSPGSLTYTFYREGAQGETGQGQVLIVQLRSPELIDQLRATTIVQAGLGLLAEPGE